MSTLRAALADYLALRRALGTQLRGPEHHLRRFVEFAEHQGEEVVTTDLVLRWAATGPHVSRDTRAARVGDVRRFASWLCVEDPRTQVPPRDLLPCRYTRRPPYIYSDEEIEGLLEPAARLPSRSGLRARTYSTLFGLLAATGLRISEALALDHQDVDLVGGVLAVRRTKSGASRFVPLHDTTTEALRHYASDRNRLRPRRATPALLLAESGRRVTGCSARYTFAVVSRTVGLRTHAGAHRHGRGPRLHDMRHRLAVRCLVRWYREGRDVERELPRLATYLGHRHVADTYWYLEAVPELLALATERAARPAESPR